MTKNLKHKDLSTFTSQMKNPGYFMKSVVSYDIIEDTESVFEVKTSECLWAKSFRASGAQDVGYACMCYPDFAAAEGYNPDLKLIRSKTLMQGHDCCNYRYVMT